MFALRLCLFLAAIATVSLSEAKTVHVRGYYRKDGTYVQPHTRSSPGSGSYTSAEPPRTSRVTTPPPEEPRTEYRTTARTSARTVPRYASGTLSPTTESHGAFLSLGETKLEPPPKKSLSDLEPSPLPPPRVGYHFPFRHWTDISGKFSVYARLVSLTGSNVKLAREDFTTIDVARSLLSVADIAYLDGLLHASH